VRCIDEIYPGDATRSALDYAIIATDKFSGSKKSKKENSDTDNKKKQSVSASCGLSLPVARFKTFFKKLCISKKTREDVHILLTGVIEWYASELMFQSLYECREADKKTVTTDFLIKAIDTDDNLDNIRQFV
jgi:histone H3/H4